MDGTDTLPDAPPAARALRGRPRVSWGLQRYLSVEVLKVFFFVLVLLEFGYALLVAVVIARRFDLDLLLVLPAFWKTSLAMLNDAVPLALLLSSGLVYGRLVADREVTALKSFGLSYAHLLLPLALAGSVSSFCGFFINGFLAPEMNYQKRNVGALLASQLRYLGEGWNRDFPFGKQNLWVLHYSGRHVWGVFLSPLKKEFIPVDVARRVDPVAESFHVFAERGEVLTPEEVRAERAARGDAEEIGPDTFLFRLYNVRIWASDQLFSDEPSPFMQRFHLDRLPFLYSPSNLARILRPKHLSFPRLREEMDASRLALASAEPGSADYPGLAERNSEILAEYYWRWARTFSFFLFPLFAGLVALILRSANRYLAFFVSCLVASSIFYGMGALGQVLAESGHASWYSMNLGTFLLAVLVLGAYVYLEARPFRRRAT